ncbi:hypothetical protein ACFCX4_20255 [Kitasatospora sp. NPDC056327]|uniref:hypothetical protein n=1 Tax=Kitasatospora sp. NPDC056327 TaxID=3345785 RepID=UPI0035D95D1C
MYDDLSTTAPAPRPEGVPAEAEYIEAWDLLQDGPPCPAWGAGARAGGRPTGRWRLWRPDGSPLEESEWLDGTRRGTLLRYRPDGTLAVRAEHHDVPSAATAGDRTERPARAPFSAVAYHRGGREVAVFPNGQAKPSPLIEAAREGDGASVELFLAAGLGASPGAARHAAYAGLPDLALRLLRRDAAGPTDPADPTDLAGPAGPGDGPGRARGADLTEVRVPPAVPSERVTDGAVWVAGLLAYVAGDLDEATGAATGTWLRFDQAWHTTTAADGPSYHAPDSVYHGYAETDFTDGRPTELRTYLGSGTLYRVDRYRPDGGLLAERRYERGVLDRECEWPADGSAVHRRFHGNGAVRAERTERDGDLVAEQWFDAEGTRLAEVAPTGDVGEEEPVERWRSLDPDGAVVAEGHVESGRRGGPVGPWRLFDSAGTELGTVSFTGLDLARNESLGTTAHTLYAWRSAPEPAELDRSGAVDWERLGTFFGRPDTVPFLLKGLTVPQAFPLALAQLSEMLLHQHTIAGATGPAFRFLTSLAGRPGDNGARAGLLQLMAAVATRDGDLDATQRLRSIMADLPADAGDPGLHFAHHGVESAYHEVYAALTAAVPTWTGLAADPEPGIRRRAVVLLAAAPGEAAARALGERLAAEPAPQIRGEILLALALHGTPSEAEGERSADADADADAEPDTRRALERHLTDDDPLLRFCAALSWVRRGHSPADPAARILVEVLRGDLDPSGYDGLYLGSGDRSTDTVTALALLPTDRAEPLLDELCATLDEVSAVDAVLVANALLDIVFPTEAYDDAEPLTDAQRTVIRAIADSTGAWVFRADLREVLRFNGLPCDADRLRTLADAAPAEPAVTP